MTDPKAGELVTAAAAAGASLKQDTRGAYFEVPATFMANHVKVLNDYVEGRTQGWSARRGYTPMRDALQYQAPAGGQPGRVYFNPAHTEEITQGIVGHKGAFNPILTAAKDPAAFALNPMAHTLESGYGSQPAPDAPVAKPDSGKWKLIGGGIGAAIGLVVSMFTKLGTIGKIIATAIGAGVGLLASGPLKRMFGSPDTPTPSQGTAVLSETKRGAVQEVVVRKDGVYYQLQGKLEGQTMKVETIAVAKPDGTGWQPAVRFKTPRSLQISASGQVDSSNPNYVTTINQIIDDSKKPDQVAMAGAGDMRSVANSYKGPRYDGGVDSQGPQGMQTGGGTRRRDTEAGIQPT